MPDPNPTTNHLARAYAVEMHINILQEPFCVETFTKNAGPQSLEKCLARACRVERHMDIEEEPFCMKI